MSIKPRTGCEPCRVRHLKCDQVTPECGRCKTSGRECTRSYNYRFQRESFADDQKWLRTPRNVTFVDETTVIKSEYNGESDTEHTLTPQEQTETPTSHYPPSSPAGLSRLQPISPGKYNHSNLGQPLEPSVTPSGPIESIILNLSPLSGGISNPAILSHHETPLPTLHDLAAVAQLADESNRSFANPETLSQHQSAQNYIYNDAEQLRSRIYLDRPVWPLTEPSEALLLRHYVQNLATWLDLCDPSRHFEVIVPARSGTCPILLNAIFALSARHLAQIGSYDPFASNRYHEECLKYLIPMLNHTATISDETLFAATIVLRVLEEIDVQTTGGTDSGGHLLGIQVFVSARDPYSNSGSLSEAAFWVGLRQEIYIATVNHKSIKINLEGCNGYRSVTPADDFCWANRAVLYCADVLNFCFGDDSLGVDVFRDLKAYGAEWRSTKPLSFTPNYFKPEGESSVFPEIWYSLGCYIIGVQHHLLALILLAIFDPLIPRVGAGRKSAMRAMEKETRANLRTMCGIGLFNRWTPPGMFTACMGIAICGDRFSERREQEALLEVLVKTEEDHARPTAAVQRQMMRAWGWIPDEGE